MAGAVERIDSAYTEAPIHSAHQEPGVWGAHPQSLRAAVMVKHVQDRVLAAGLFVALVPLMVAIAVMVKLSSRGPVLYRAARVGEGGRTFEMLKFRTMTGSPATRGEADADWVAGVLRMNGNVTSLGAQTHADERDRRTRVGRLLRRTCLDELPQLWNVIRGEMSIVGPRPERVAYSQLFSAVVYGYSARHRVRPGITGWAQVHGLRGRTSLTRRVVWDNFYIDNWSLWLDLRVLLLTPVAVLRTRER